MGEGALENGTGESPVQSKEIAIPAGQTWPGFRSVCAVLPTPAWHDNDWEGLAGLHKQIWGHARSAAGQRD